MFLQAVLAWVRVSNLFNVDSEPEQNNVASDKVILMRLVSDLL